MGQMTVNDALLATRRALEEAGIEDAGFDGLQLACRALQIDRSHLLADRQKFVTSEQMQTLKALTARRQSGEPLQYILGEWEFYGLTFSVGPGVLIPRADTELLVDEALRFCEAMSAPKIADLCAGTGCVGIALAHERPDGRVTCMEKSPEALTYCRRNADALAPQNVTVRQADVLLPPPEEEWDLIVSNPPYIPTGDIAGLSAEVGHEPQTALDGGTDGLDFYRRITELWQPRITREGALLFEVGIHQAQAVTQLLTPRFERTYIVPDLAGIPRVVIGHLPKVLY